ncbi:unnamed protein product [Phytomonas sp. Hart1]|nr:unnamed protein product [Phytomonas sp. Hart1]|eukprot:CCW67736.1 unnamed protein product [Phytomonas sp. isolate Hart1]
MGLPVQLKDPQRGMGLSQAIYEAGDASLFDPDKVEQLEDAMIHTKQLFADFVRKKREGLSTESERRRLANRTAELNLATQRHLADLCKYAQVKLRGLALAESQAELRTLHQLRERLAARKARGLSGAPASKPSSSPAQRRARLTASVGKALGLEVEVMAALLAELEAQEQFLRFCEVFARLTLGEGFRHAPGDEGLEAYTESLRKLYSADPQTLSTLEVVQFMAAKAEAHPVEWAKRWYEKALLLPLQHTPEYQRLRAIQQADQAALARRTAGGDSAIAEVEGAETAETAAGDPAKDAIPAAPPTARREGASGHAEALNRSQLAAQAATDDVERLVSKMFLRPDDPRLEGLHEKRLRYVAYLQLERQILQARENARRFAGVEALPEAAECRALYRQLQARKAAMAPEGAGGSSDEETPASQAASSANLFAVDPEAAAIFERLQAITSRVIAEYRAKPRAGPVSPLSGIAKRAQTVARVIEKSFGGPRRSEEAKRQLCEQKEAVARRLLGVLERDVLSEVAWLDAMEEAERPPLLPLPEGMSYTSAADVQAWKGLREAAETTRGDPFAPHRRAFQPALLGQAWDIPDRPLLFWGTGSKVVQQALRHAAEDAERRRQGVPLPPPYPCPENPWGWRLAKDILDD